MKLPILKYPDPRLRELSLPVTDFTPELKKLADDMLETMHDARGIGLAAPQVGVLKRMLVIDCRPKEGGRYKIEEMTELEQKVTQPLVVLNPRVVAHRGSTTFDEGCLSVPSFFETVKRHDWIRLEYEDLDGVTRTLETDGLLAIVIQHEMDHLEGTLFIDRISFVKSNRIKNQIKKTGYPEREKVVRKTDSEEPT